METVTQVWPIVLGAGGALLLWLWSQTWNRESYCPYYRRDSILTRNEQRFYAALHQAIRGEWAIFAMVRMADLIKVEPEATQRQAWQNRINCKHIDFVLCDPNELEPRLAIELDDRSHQRPDRIRRDEFVNDALDAAQLPLLRVPAAAHYSPGEIRDAITEFLPETKRTRRRPAKRARRRRDRSDA